MDLSSCEKGRQNAQNIAQNQVLNCPVTISVAHESVLGSLREYIYQLFHILSLVSLHNRKKYLKPLSMHRIQETRFIEPSSLKREIHRMVCVCVCVCVCLYLCKTTSSGGQRDFWSKCVLLIFPCDDTIFSSSSVLMIFALKNIVCWVFANHYCAQWENASFTISLATSLGHSHQSHHQSHHLTDKKISAKKVL